MKSRLKRQNERLQALYAIALDLLNHHKVDEVLDTIIRRASELLDSPIGFLDLIDGDILITKATTKPVKSQKGSCTPLKNAPLTALSIETRQPQLVDSYLKRSNRVKTYDPFRMQAACTFPIMLDDKAVGALSLSRTRPNYPFTKEDVDTMRALAQLAALAFQSANLFEETHRKSVTDGLTGLANRRRLDTFLAQEWAHAMRMQKPLALIIADIDSFKKYNDAYGHAAGDECLRRIGHMMQRIGRRTSDLAARYGGDELVLVLPLTSLSDAKRMAEELRRQVEALRIPHQTSEIKPWVTVSAGVATIVPKRNSDPLRLINLADQALYKAKRTGRNRVCSARKASVKR